MMWSWVLKNGHMAFSYWVLGLGRTTSKVLQEVPIISPGSPRTQSFCDSSQDVELGVDIYSTQNPKKNQQYQQTQGKDIATEVGNMWSIIKWKEIHEL